MNRRTLTQRALAVGLPGKLLGGFGAVLVMLTIVAVSGYSGIGSVADEMRNADRRAVLDEQIMSMEIAGQEASAPRAWPCCRATDPRSSGCCESPS